MYLIEGPGAGIDPDRRDTNIRHNGSRLLADHGVIVYYQHSDILQGIFSHTAPFFFLGVVDWLQRHTQLKGGAAVLFAGHRNGAAHELDNVIDNGQPQPGADLVSGCSGVLLLKGLVNLLHKFLRHSNACIAHAEPKVRQPIFTLQLPNIHSNPAAGCCELHSVGEQVHHDLVQTQLITDVKTLHGLMMVDHKVNPTLPGLGIDDGIDLIDKLGEIKLPLG